jgi:hypothetical protein
MASTLDRLTDAEAMKFINQVAEPFKSLPHLPKGVTEFLVKIIPWLALLGFFGSLIVILGALPAAAFGSIYWVISLVVNAITAYLLFSSFTPLKNRELKGWIYLFWIQVMGLVGNLVGLLVGSYSSVIGVAIGFLIGMYLLFEIRPFYGAVQSTVKKVTDSTK